MVTATKLTHDRPALGAAGEARAHLRPAWYDELVVSYTPSIQKRAWRYTNQTASADDLVQDTIAQALAHWPGYDRDSSMYGWLGLMMRNAIVLSVRASKRERESSAISPGMMYAQARPTQEAATDLSRVRALLAEIPDGGDLLAHAAGVTYGEIGRKTGVSRQRAEQKLNRARGLLLAGLGA